MESVGVTGYKLSKATGISESLFGKWKAKPTSKIDATTLKKISDYFGMSIDALIGNEQKNKPKKCSFQKNTFFIQSIETACYN